MTYKEVKQDESDDVMSRDDDEVSRDQMCGAGSWRPPSLQKFANIKTFTTVLSMWSLFGSVNFTYFSSAISTIEKEYGLPSSVSGFIKNVDNIGFMVTVLFFSHFCRDANKPRLFAIVTIFSSGAVFLFAVPHFIYGHIGRDFTQVLMSNITSQDSAKQSPVQAQEFCDGVVEEEVEAEQFCGSRTLQALNVGALAIFVVSEILQGVAQSPKFPLSLTYMDDNAKDDSPKYFSFMFAMRAFSPVLGYMLGAWTSTLYVTLKDPGFSQSDPRWVGAWWLGFVLCAGASLIWAVPMALFPPVLKDASGQKHIDTTHQKQQVKDKLSEFPRAIKRLVTNKLYVILVLGLGFDIYVMGYFTFLPKYFQQIFGTTPAVASLAVGCIASIAIGIGPLIGGKIVTVRKRITAYWSCLIIVATTAASILGYLVLMQFGCEEAEWAGELHRDGPELSMECNSACSCDSIAFNPVCGDDGVNYYSPCHAGCTGMDNINGTKVYTGCNCTLSGEATAGQCPRDCPLMIPFAVVLFITKLVSVLDKVPSITLFMRVAGNRDKALAIALAGMFLQVAAFPAPMVFGYILDTACLVLHGSCSKSGRGRRGACALYDNTAVRHRVHLAAVGVKSVALCFYLVATYISRRPEYALKTEEDGEGEGQSEKEMRIKAGADVIRNGTSGDESEVVSAHMSNV